MKKFIFALLGIILFCFSSCVEQSPQEIKEIHSEMYQKRAEVIELTFPDEEGVPRTHEYVVLAYSEYRSGFDHYIHCNYCKKH